MEQNGTMKTRAGCACQKQANAKYVVVRLSPQANSIEQKRGKVNSSSFLGFLLLRMQQSISYLMQRESNNPGSTISPNPNILNFIASSCKQGNFNFNGKSILFATVTITSDSYTQYRSQKKRSHRTGKAILNDRILAYLIASKLKVMPYILSINQCLVMTSSIAGRKQITGKIMFMVMNLIMSANWTEMLEESNILETHLETWEWHALIQYRVERTMNIALRTSSIVTCSTFVTKKQRISNMTVAVRGYTPISQHLFMKPPSSAFLSFFQQF